MSNQNYNREAYLDRVDRELSGLDLAERSSVLDELANHYDDLQVRIREDGTSSNEIHRQAWSVMGDPAGVGSALRDEHLKQGAEIQKAIITGLPFLVLGVLLAQPLIRNEYWFLWSQTSDPLPPLVLTGGMLAVAVGLYVRYQWSWLSTAIGLGAFLTLLPLTRLLDITSGWPISAAWLLLCIAVVVPAAVLFTVRAGVQHTIVALLAGTGGYGIFALSGWVSGNADIALVVVPFCSIVLFCMVRRRYWVLAGISGMIGVWGSIFIIPMQYYGAHFGPIPALAPAPHYNASMSVGDWISLPLVAATLLLIAGAWLLLQVQDLDSIRTIRMNNLNNNRQRALSGD